MKKLLKKGAVLYVVLFCGLLLWWTFVDQKATLVTNERVTVIRDVTKAGLHTTALKDLDIIPINVDFGNETNGSVKKVWSWDTKIHEDIGQYLQSDYTACNGNFQAFKLGYAKLVDVTIDPKYGIGRLGGENISEVFNQKEEDEYFRLQKGYFQLQCNQSKIEYVFSGKTHLRTWMECVNVSQHFRYNQIIKQWTIAVLRYEYANLYHTMTDYYNAFFLAKVFNINPNNVTIMFIDGHPKGALDTPWQYLFRNYIRAGAFKGPVRLKRLLWGIMGYDSFLNHHSRETVPYLEEFRQFFLTRHGVSTLQKLNCDKLNVLILWRRDYLAHPRNPSGVVSRKIKNENELLTKVKELLPGHNVYGVQIDKYSMRKQLLIISKTDILIGMHGAGLSHTLFLPKHAGLIEFYPVYWSTSNQHFKAMAKWRHLHYLTWNNVDSKRELPNKYTIIDADKTVAMVKEMRTAMCP